MSIPLRGRKGDPPGVPAQPSPEAPAPAPAAPVEQPRVRGKGITLQVPSSGGAPKGPTPPRKIRIPTVSPTASVYLLGLEETFEVVGGAEVLQTPHGPIEAAGRLVVGGERRTLFHACPELGTEAYCLRLAHLALGPLADDYLVFLDPRGRPVDTPLRALAPAGARRRFHLMLLLAEALGKLDRPEHLEAVMSEALGQRIRTTPDGLYTLDDAMNVLARPHPDLPTLPSAARAVGLFLGVCLQLPHGYEILGGRVPIFEYRTSSGILRLRAGEVAREALLQPDRASMLVETLRGANSLVRDPWSYPPDPLLRWLEWAPEAELPRSADGREAAALARDRRQATLDAGDVDDSPEVARAWRCAGCGRLHMDLQTLRDAAPVHLDEARLRLRRAVDSAAKGVPCRCGAMLPQRGLQFAHYAHSLAWPGVDLRLEIERLEDGRLVESWGRSEPAGELAPLPGEPSSQTLQEALGRRYSLAAPWVELMEAAARSGQVESAPAGGLARLVVLPPGRAEETARRLEELLAPARGRACRVVTLSGTPPDAGMSYRTWAPDFAGRLEEGTFGAAAVVDWMGFAELVLRTLRAEGLEPAVDPERPGRILLSDMRSWGSLDLGEELAAGLRSGRYPEEVALGAVRRARQALREMQKALVEVERVAGHGRVEVLADQRLLRVSFPDREALEVGIDALLASGDGLERDVRYLLGAEVPTLDSCRCGEAAHLAVKVRSSAWLEALPGGRGGRLARRNAGGPPQVYVRECPYHLVYLEWADLERSGVGPERVEAVLERDLDRTGGRFRVLHLADPTRWAVAVVGTDAASLGAHPSLLAGACEAAGLEVPPQVEVAAPDVHLLLACAPGIPAAALAPLTRLAGTRLDEGPGRGGELGWRCALEKAPARGRFQIEALEPLGE